MSLRFRDENGCLTISTDEIAKATLAEARSYYQDGAYYIFLGRLYIFCEEDCCFISTNPGKFITVNSESLGTFLPDVASDGLAFILAPDQEKAAAYHALGLDWDANDSDSKEEM